MSREWKPGDLADIHGSRVMRVRGNRWAWRDGVVTDERDAVQGARPLVVIDPEDREAVERLCDAFDLSMKSADPAYYEDASEWEADEDIEVMQAALRAFANPTPPRPDEPQGLGAVVEDASGRLWFRMSIENHTWPGEVWMERYEDADRWSKWEDVPAVRVLSPGVEVES